MDPSVPDSEVRKQYILLTASGSGTTLVTANCFPGLGNEVEATISCLLLAILTKRALVIQNAVTAYWEYLR